MRSVTVGSKKWCDEWAAWYWNRAIKYSNHPDLNEDRIDVIMYSMFLSYMWTDTKPWTTIEGYIPS